MEKYKAVGINADISKPSSDKLLYGKTIKYLKQANADKTAVPTAEEQPNQALTCINFDYLK